jgi:hypothetical protein
MPQVFVPPFTKAKYTGKSAPNTRNFSADNFIPQTFQNSAFPGGGPFSTIGETGGGCCGYGGGMQRLKLNPATGLPETTGISCFCNGKNEEGVIFPCFPGSIYAYYCYALGPDGLGDTVLALFAIVDIYCGDMATTFPGGFSRFYSFPMVYTDYESCSLPVVNVWYYDDWQSSSQPPMAGISWNNIPTYSLTVNPIYGTIASCVPIPFIAGAEA